MADRDFDKLLEEDKYLRQFFNAITKTSTAQIYRQGMRVYLSWVQMTPAILLEEAQQDQLRLPLERENIVLQRLQEFLKYLKKDYTKAWVSQITKKKRIRTEAGLYAVAPSKPYGVSDNTALTWYTAVRSFYSHFGFTVQMKGKSKPFVAKTERKKFVAGPEDVRKLVDAAGNARNQAIILTIYQSGVDCETVCDLRYGQVSKALQENQHPIRLDLLRKKSGVEYYTFIGADAAGAIAKYLKEYQLKVDFHDDTPLFVDVRRVANDGGEFEWRGITPNTVQLMMRGVAVKSGLVKEDMPYNPLSAHALRSSFSSLMWNTGVPESMVDFWLGHEVGTMAEAYKKLQFDLVRQQYLDHESHISITQAAKRSDEEELRLKLAKQIREEEKEWLVGTEARIVEVESKLKDKDDEIDELKALTKQLSTERGEELEAAMKQIEGLKKITMQLADLKGVKVPETGSEPDLAMPEESASELNLVHNSEPEPDLR